MRFVDFRSFQLIKLNKVEFINWLVKSSWPFLTTSSPLAPPVDIRRISTGRIYNFPARGIRTRYRARRWASKLSSQVDACLHSNTYADGQSKSVESLYAPIKSEAGPDLLAPCKTFNFNVLSKDKQNLWPRVTLISAKKRKCRLFWMDSYKRTKF